MSRRRSVARPLVSGLALTVALAAPLSGQRASELRLAASPPVRSAAAPDTIASTRNRVDVEMGVIGGVLGGTLGGVAGIGIGVAAARDCTGDYCGLVEVGLGLIVGESVGLAVGAHLGSKGRANPVAVTLASLAVGVAGTVLGAHVGGWPILLVPVAQLATVLSLEHP